MKDLRSKVICSDSKGFTLIEIMVASIIGAFIAVIAVGTLRSVSKSSEKVNDNIDKAAEIRFASKMISSDLINLYRDKDFKNMIFVGTIENGPQGESANFRFYIVSRSKARLGQPEGDVYEVEYYVDKNEHGSKLMRRYWPNPDKDSEPGGLLTAIANDIEIFDVRYFDGQEWQNEWSEDRNSLPELVDVSIGAKASSEKRPVVESFFINLKRSEGGEVGTFETDQEQTETAPQ